MNKGSLEEGLNEFVENENSIESVNHSSNISKIDNDKVIAIIKIEKNVVKFLII